MSQRRLITRVRRVDPAPIVAVRLWLRGGARVEEIPGQALLTGRLLAEGTAHRDWERISLDAEDRGMVLQSFGTYESIGVSIDALAEDWEEALALLAELIFEPSFPEDRCDWLRRQALGELESMLDQPAIRTGRAHLEQLYRAHPYGRDLQGNPESLARLGTDHCAAFHRRALSWGGLISVTGQIDEDAVKRRLSSLFAACSGEAEELPEVAPPPALRAARHELAVDGVDQAHLYAGHLTLPRDHPDTTPLAVLAVALGAGAGMSGRLPERIREREGLAYHVDVATFSGAGLDAGRCVIYVGTSPETVTAAESAVREELARLLADGIEDEEFEEARSYLIGRDPFRRETARQWADLLAEAEFYGLRTDRSEWVVEQLKGLEKRDVEAAARRWCHPEKLCITLGRPKPRA